MQSDLLGALRSRQPEIRARWTELLRVEPVNTPLAHPEALAHLIDWTVSEIFSALGAGRPRRHSTRDNTGTPYRLLCACGRNPLLSYFDAAGQALREALILAQAALPFLDPIERDVSLEELNIVLQQVARHEIDAFCGVCQHRLKTDEHVQCGAVLAHAPG
jgi:hypothetical protein